MTVYERFLKRTMDVSISLVALVCLGPVFALIAFAILVEDGRPVVFRQRRVGREGADFVLFKFRSMPTSAAEAPSGELVMPTVTRVGSIIRRTNLDELPQLTNILRGDMSIVGPRPPLPSQAELIALRRASGALACRPGLTGLAQVLAYDGMPAEVKARFDGEYARSITFRGDVSILYRTVGYLRRRPPVY